MDESENQVIELRNRVVVLKILPFNTDIDVDDLLRIDYSNLVGEMLTFPVLLNRIMNLKAEMQSIVSESKVDLEVLEAQLTEQKRKSLTSLGQKTTISEVEAAVRMDATYIARQKLYFSQVKNLDYLDSLYWSAQSKSKLLEKISDKIRPSEFEGELLTDTINGVAIKMARKAIP
jgi:flagellar motor protein MotB